MISDYLQSTNDEAVDDEMATSRSVRGVENKERGERAQAGADKGDLQEGWDGFRFDGAMSLHCRQSFRVNGCNKQKRLVLLWGKADATRTPRISMVTAVQHSSCRFVKVHV